MDQEITELIKKSGFMMESFSCDPNLPQPQQTIGHSFWYRYSKNAVWVKSEFMSKHKLLAVIVDKLIEEL